MFKEYDDNFNGKIFGKNVTTQKVKNSNRTKFSSTNSNFYTVKNEISKNEI